MTDLLAAQRSLLEETRRLHGNWTAHQICLGPGIYTMETFNPNHLLYLRRITQIVCDVLGKDLEGKRIIDLGCLEGGFAIELALRGAQVVAVDGRQQNIAKVECVKEILGLENLSAKCCDVRSVNRETFGSFDAVLCLGLLYHFEAQSVWDVLRSLYMMTSNVCIIDTHISFYNRESHVLGGTEYYGSSFLEHRHDESEEVRVGKNWASLHNEVSFFPTESSLYNMIADVGFSSAMVCKVPYYRIGTDRRTVVAFRREDIGELLSFDKPVSAKPQFPEQDTPVVVSSVNELPTLLHLF